MFSQKNNPLFAKKKYLKAFILLNFVSLGLKFFGFNFCKNFLKRLALKYPKISKVDHLAQARYFGNLTSFLAKYAFFRSKCLEISLLTWFFCLRAGISAELKIGSRFVAGELQAHAWVEVRSEVVTEPEDPRSKYVPFQKGWR